MSTTDTQLTIRTLDRDDEEALRRLAGRDSATSPSLPALGAELDGELVAALSLSDPSGRPLADPFVATAGAVELLRMRAAQLHAADHPRHGDRRRRRRAGLPRARGALAGSPPGGSRLLQL